MNLLSLRRRPLRTIRLAALVASAGILGLVAPAWAQNASDQRPRYDLWWDVKTSTLELERGSRIDWAKRFTFGDMPVNRTVLWIGEQHMIEDVRQQGLRVTRNANWRQQLAERMRVHFDKQGPADVVGVGMLNVEYISPFYGNRTAGPNLHGERGGPARRQYDMWYDYIRTERPELLAGKSTAEAEEILAATYREAARDLFLTILQEAKRLRPNVKWGYFGYPLQYNMEYAWPEPNPWRRMNDEISWLYEAVDVVMPCIYQPRKWVPDGAPRPTGHYTHDTFNRQFVTQNLREARRVAGPDKPVLPIAALQFWEYTPFDGVMFNEGNLRHSVVLPKEVGMDGVLIWGDIRSEAQFNTYQAYINNMLIPMLQPHLSPPPAPANTALQLQGGNQQAPATNNRATGQPNSAAVQQQVAQQRTNAQGESRTTRSVGAAPGARPAQRAARPSTAPIRVVRPARPGVTRVNPDRPPTAQPANNPNNN